MRLRRIAVIVLVGILLVIGLSCTSYGISGSISYQLTTITEGQGSISPSEGSFPDGDSVTITALAASGWEFDHWGGSINGYQNPITTIMSSDKTIYAYFVEGVTTPTPTSTPTATATPHSTVTPTPTTPPVGSVTVSIDSPDTVVKSSGRYFHALVKITDVTNFDAAQYDITYDPDVIRIQDVTAGDISGTAIPIEEWGYVPANTQGTVKITNSVPNASGISGEGYLADIYFKVMGDPGDSSVISFIEGFGDPQGYLMIGNNAGIEITATWTNSLVTIE
jgi:hypothetical protein